MRAGPPPTRTARRPLPHRAVSPNQSGQGGLGEHRRPAAESGSPVRCRQTDPLVAAPCPSCWTTGLSWTTGLCVRPAGPSVSAGPPVSVSVLLNHRSLCPSRWTIGLCWTTGLCVRPAEPPVSVSILLDHRSPCPPSWTTYRSLSPSCWTYRRSYVPIAMNLLLVLFPLIIFTENSFF